MALVQFGGGATAMSGKQAGNVFARNRAGAYSRGWVKPVNPSTVPQNDARSRFADAAALWMALTASQVDGWNALAAGAVRLNRFGEPYTPTGRQLFMESASNLRLLGQATLTNPPSTSLVPAVSDVGITNAAAAAGLFTNLSIEWKYTGVGDATSGADNFVVIYGAPAHPAQKTNVNKQRRVVLIDAADTSPNDLHAAFNAYFGPTSADGRVVDLWIKGVQTDTGFASTPVKVSAVIT